MNRMMKKYKYTGLVAICLLFTLAACRKWLPDDLGYLSPSAVYTQTEFYPILGRTTEYARIFNTDDSNTPIHFEITNVRDRATGKPSKDLDKKVSTWVWTKAYTGYEKSLSEINAKRKKEEHSVWEIRETSGDFIMWADADSTMLLHQPDSGYLFDVVASNTGGTQTYKNLVLDPYKNQPYSPYNRDAVTGEILKLYPNPNDSSIFKIQYTHPSLVNVTNARTDEPLENDSVRVFFRKTGDGNTLTFKFLDKDSMLINPALFNRTVWDSLVHGFNVQISDTSVRYDVAYPIPLVHIRTRYTSGNGGSAVVEFKYDRIAYGNIRRRATLHFAFNIYEKGDWEIIFYFHGDNPKFKND